MPEDLAGLTSRWKNRGVGLGRYRQTAVVRRTFLQRWRSPSIDDLREDSAMIDHK